MIEMKKAPSLEEIRKKEYLSAADLSVLLGIKRSMSYRLIAPGGPIPSFRIGRLRRCRRSDVDRYAEEHLNRKAK